jgi:prepilin-type N-terminal cleavage/methylation domain-containing protein
MKDSRGFTLIELLIALVIMAILMTLAVVNVRSTQVNARDTERKADIESIARGLEQNYTMDNKFGTNQAGDKPKGSYPGNNNFKHAGGADFCPSSSDPVTGYIPCNSTPNGYLYSFLPGVTEATLHAPQNADAISLKSTWYFPPDNPTRQIWINGSVLDSDYYMYEPLNSDGTMCNAGTCRQFKLYYKNEVTNSVQILKSKNQ